MLGFTPFAANPFAAVIAGDQIVDVTGVEATGWCIDSGVGQGHPRSQSRVR